MTQSIEAILFDMGGTLRGSVRNDPKTRQGFIRQIIEQASLGEGDWDARFEERNHAYFRWARETQIELNEPRLWTEWMLPDQPAERIAPIAVTLNQLWRSATGVRTVFPETKEVVTELFRRGYRLGLVSNTTSSVEIPRLLRELELSGCFETVILSCEVGMRKPGPAILLEAAKRMGIEPDHCVYVGDRLDRDLPAARGAGFSQVVLLGGARSAPDGLEPDHLIHNLRELLDLFPPQPEPQPQVTYQASLSTMWNKRNFPSLADFIRQAARSGYAGVELNHQIDSSMLDGLDLENLPISSLHEPCPADIPVDTLKERDWLISSPDDERRRHGVESILRSVMLASRLNLPVVVVHCGMVTLDMTDEKKLRGMLEVGDQGSPEYLAILEKMRSERLALIGPRFEAVQRSLRELLAVSGDLGVRLGLENRYHFFDLPSPDEMEILLGMAGPEFLGFTYDAGHAQALDQLGFYPHEDWLRRFAPRIIETHLHDVIGATDHLAPGRGEVDFDMVARYLPAGALRILELHPSNSPDQVRSALKFLAAHGCIQSTETT